MLMKNTVQTLKESFGLNASMRYQSLPNIFHQAARAQAIKTPKVVWKNDALAQTLGLQLSDDNPLWSRFFAGQWVSEELPSLAQAYAGHQYGHLSVLGDGRAVLLCEHTHQDQTFEVHLKGSGPTPFARRGDGQATLYSMLKEALYSEALHQLGVPSTRTLMVGLTGIKVPRETMHPGAHAVRIAQSHLRVGTFEWAALHQDKTHLEALLRFAIERHDPHLDPRDALGFFEAVVKRQATLIALWQSLGFVHGVMNTDNMALSGETLDYGPCAFLDTYQPHQTFSSIDSQGRYAFGQQPHIASWNLAKLAIALLPLLGEDKPSAIEAVSTVLERFGPWFEASYRQKMGAKFGFATLQEEEITLLNRFLELLQHHRRDYTLSFLDLTYDRYDDPFYQQEAVQAWLSDYQRICQTHPNATQLKRQHNPALIPRNATVDRHLKTAEAGDLTPFLDYMEALKNPYQHTPMQQRYAAPPLDNPTRFTTTCGT